MAVSELEKNLVETDTELLQPQVERGLTLVPPRFLLPDVISPSATRRFTLPVLSFKDLAGEKRGDTMAKLKHACETWGFFQVVDHGIPISVIDSMREASSAFFKSSIEDKKLCANGKEGRVAGYGRLFKGTETSRWDWVDVLTHRVGPLPLTDQDSSAWPSKPASYKPAMEEYSEEVRRFSQRLSRLLSENLNLPPELMEEAFGSFPSQVVRLNYYPPCPQPELVMGLSSHSDPGAITILLQVSDVCGLQVRKDGDWVSVNPEPNALIVNMGDQMEVITNGRYKSVEHQVVVNQSQSRLSIATFCSPLLNTVISPLPQLLHQISHPNCVLYPNYTFRDYVRLYMKHELGGKRFLECVRDYGNLPMES